ncbi:MAG: aminotransferase class I/II-fold pyridoxal phosphate-dependent enzyme [Pseudomonadota bacterium]
MARRFTGSFTQQAAIPEQAIAAAIDVMRSGRLHRYNTSGDEVPQVSQLEAEYAAWQGSRYCLAVTSGGQAMQIALRAAGVGPGDHVLTNGFTLAPVPGAIAAVGGIPRLVEITPDLTLDLDDLEAKASGARALLLSNMRGHLCDMDALAAICDRLGLLLIEDCAHTMGASWNGTRSGNFGVAGCFSTQTYKHMNSGEGGFLTSDDPDLMARAIILSGSYMLYERHGAAPPAETFRDIRLDTPNMSARLDNLRAAVLRPQLEAIEGALTAWTERHDLISDGLRGTPGLRLPQRPTAETYVGSSLQFCLDGISRQDARKLLASAAARGVELKWFGADEPQGFTSAHSSWRYVPAQNLPCTDAVLAGLFDLRIPLSFSPADCRTIAQILSEEVRALNQVSGPAISVPVS